MATGMEVAAFPSALPGSREFDLNFVLRAPAVQEFPPSRELEIVPVLREAGEARNGIETGRRLLIGQGDLQLLPGGRVLYRPDKVRCQIPREGVHCFILRALDIPLLLVPQEIDRVAVPHFYEVRSDSVPEMPVNEMLTLVEWE